MLLNYVCIIYFDVLVLITFLKPDRYCCEVTKPINNPDVMYETFHWLVRPFVTQKSLDSKAIYIQRELSLDLVQTSCCLKFGFYVIHRNKWFQVVLIKMKILSKRTIALALASHSLNQLLCKF